MDAEDDEDVVMEGGDDDDDDEDELPEALRKLLERPLMGLDELLAEAKIDFSDPDLIDEDGFGEGFRAGECVDTGVR